jgi:hypothetical protein
MPKPKKTKREKTQEHENWSWNGFGVGILAGIPVYFLALSHGTNPLLAIARIVTLGFFVFGLFLTLYDVYRRKAYFSPMSIGSFLRALY